MSAKELSPCDMQTMWENMGVTWEWTWYSQTVHAFTEPQGVGAGATMVCAVLCWAGLGCAVLCCAVLCCAVLCCAVLCCAVLCCEKRKGHMVLLVHVHANLVSAITADVMTTLRRICSQVIL